jgi:hypothetical protein
VFWNVINAEACSRWCSACAFEKIDAVPDSVCITDRE